MAEGTDLSNWRDPDRMIWSFQNVDKILPVDTIAKRPETTSLPYRRQCYDSLEVPSSIDGRKLNLNSFLAEIQTDGIVLLENGNVIFEHYDRDNWEKSVHAAFSITKSVRGLLSGILAATGELDVDAKVAKYVSEVHGTPYENIIVRQLLDMRAGIDYDDSHPEYRSASGLPCLKDGENATNLHSFITAFQAPFSAAVEGLDGNPFQYLSVNADLMGWVLERASGRRFAELVTERIWQPMGAEDPAFMALDRSGNAIAAMGLCATVRDLARLGQQMLVSDDFSKRIIPESWVQDMLNNGSQEAFAAGLGSEEFEEIFKSVTYRSCWTEDEETEMLMAFGLCGQCLLVDRNNELVLSVSASQPERTNWDKLRLTLRAFREFARVLNDEPYAQKRI